jgi:phage tail sheath gpL-like
MRNRNMRLRILIAAFFAISIVATTLQQSGSAATFKIGLKTAHLTSGMVPIVISGNNVYLVWSSNKSGNDEVMFKASTDGGKTFGNKMNLSNSTNSESQDVQIAAAVNNVYVTWWERNQTSNEPVLRISNDNGKTFGEMIMLSSK